MEVLTGSEQDKTMVRDQTGDMAERREPKLRVSGLVKRFDGAEVLHGLDFDVRDGEFLSILGPSGCGKTTTLRILIGLLDPDEGAILLDGRDITAAPPDDRSMGIVFQNYALFENMTVRGNVEYALKFNPELRARRRETAERVLEQLGMAEHIDKSVRQLSGGQQQRVSIARTLALNPKVILFDEPMSALDVETRLSLRLELKRIQKEFGTTMIYITHDQEEAFALSDRVMVMGEGRIHQLATPDDMIAHPADDYVADFVVKNLNIKMESLARFMDR
ncbi:ABC transporter ATP-binding protein [Gordonibacter urolithinfaciens]|uniref:ABC transporter ATP-binding protein n=1 Tax=Gordonibacter urolithinfaciens TaxID=1335613 RepID=UPI003AAC1827